MIMKSFAVYDKGVKAYLMPFFVRHRGEALRSFMEHVQDEKSPFRKYPDDYVLFALGDYDDASGIFQSAEPERLLSARDVLVSSADGRPS